MKFLEDQFGPWIIRHRWWVILLTLVLVAGATSGARYLTFTTDYRVFFAPDNPELQAFEALEKNYTKEDNVLFLLAPKDRAIALCEYPLETVISVYFPISQFYTTGTMNSNLYNPRI